MLARYDYGVGPRPGSVAREGRRFGLPVFRPDSGSLTAEKQQQTSQEENVKKAVLVVTCVLLAGLALAQEFEQMIPLPDSSTPTAGAWSRTQNQVYITCPLKNEVVVINGSDNSIITFLDVGVSPEPAVWHARNDRVYVGNVGDSTVSVIDCASNSVVKTIKVGAHPWVLASDTVNNKVFSADEYSRTVSVIDAGSDSVIATLTVGTYPYDMVVCPEINRLYVACEGNATVVPINTQNNTALMPIPVGQYPWSLTYNPMSHRVYCACYGDSTVEVIDGDRRTKVIHGVGTQPVSVAYGTGYVYCANQHSNDVAVIGTLNDSLIKKIRFNSGDKPKRMLWDPAKSKMYCALSGAGQVAVLQADSLLKRCGARIGPEGMVLNSAYERVYVACPLRDTVVVLRDTPPSGVKALPVERPPQAGALAVFPQPARGWFCLETGDLTGGRLSIYDCQGRLWNGLDIVVAGGRARVDLPAPPGVYLLKFDAGQETRFGRILVAR